MNTTFFPVSNGFLKSALEDFTVDGRRQYGSPVKVGLSVVNLRSTVNPTSIRADQSGSKSYAEEQTEVGRVLVHPRHVPKENDLLEVFDETYQIMSVRKVVNMFGRIDHYQVELGVWASE